MQFREHKGSLVESLKTLAVIANTKTALLEHIFKEFGIRLRWEDLDVKYYATDERPDGFPFTYIVTGRGYGVLGYTDCNPDDA